jgi:nucleotide-binding universal stress UspA family protein
LVGRVVVVASSDVSRSELEEVVEPDDELVVVVPAVEQSFLEWLANDEDDARERARELGETIDERAPTDAERVEVKPDDPVQAVEDAVAEHKPDRIVLAVRDGDEATWLEQGTLGEAPTAIAGVPVTRIRV